MKAADLASTDRFSHSESIGYHPRDDERSRQVNQVDAVSEPVDFTIRKIELVCGVDSNGAEPHSIHSADPIEKALKQR